MVSPEGYSPPQNDIERKWTKVSVNPEIHAIYNDTGGELQIKMKNNITAVFKFNHDGEIAGHSTMSDFGGKSSTKIQKDEMEMIMDEAKKMAKALCGKGDVNMNTESDAVVEKVSEEKHDPNYFKNKYGKIGPTRIEKGLKED